MTDLLQEDKQEILDKILYELADSSSKFQDSIFYNKITTELEALFDPEELWFPDPSGFFSVLLHIVNGDAEGNIDELALNIAYLRCAYEAMDNEHLAPSIRDGILGMCNQVNLEIAHISYINKIKNDTLQTEIKESIAAIQTTLLSYDEWLKSSQEALSKMNNQVEKSSKASESALNELDYTKMQTQELQQSNEKLVSKIKNTQLEMVSILGIFASIVLTFTGGLSFSTSVFQSMAVLSIYRVSALILLLGITLMNILFTLFYYIDRMTNPSAKARLVPFLIGNGVLLFLLFAVIWGRNSGYFPAE